MRCPYLNTSHHRGWHQLIPLRVIFELPRNFHGTPTLEPKYQDSSCFIFELISHAEDDRARSSGGPNRMARRRESASGNGLTPEQRERLERIVVQLLEIAARCSDPEIQHKLMQLADQLVELAEG